MSEAKTPTIHVLAGFNADGYATRTRCGLTDLEHVPAMFPGEGLRGVHWGKPYVVKGRWCRTCGSAMRRQTTDVASRKEEAR